jgi:hypothetical protein
VLLVEMIAWNRTKKTRCEWRSTKTDRNQNNVQNKQSRLGRGRLNGELTGRLLADARQRRDGSIRRFTGLLRGAARPGVKKHASVMEKTEGDGTERTAGDDQCLEMARRMASESSGANQRRTDGRVAAEGIRVRLGF